MKIIYALLVIFLCSCTANSNRLKDLEQRIAELERKLDSVTSQSAVNTATFQPVYSNKQPGIQQSTRRCQAITKKGTQCKRQEKTGGLCWQHGMK